MKIKIGKSQKHTKNVKRKRKTKNQNKKRQKHTRQKPKNHTKTKRKKGQIFAELLSSSTGGPVVGAAGLLGRQLTDSAGSGRSFLL
jgi:chemotaxis response regulator CheB